MNYVDKQPSRMQGSSQGRGIRPKSRGRGSGLFGVAHARHPKACNARWGYLERHVIIDLAQKR
jgi:hypothetical protein